MTSTGTAGGTGTVRGHLSVSLAGRVVRRYLHIDGPTWATNIAWNALVAVVPLVLILLTALAVLIVHAHGGVAAAARVGANLRTPTERQLARDLITGLRAAPWSLAVAAAVTLVWRGSSLFTAVDKGMAHAYEIPPRPFLSQRLTAIGVMAVFSVALLPLLLSSAMTPYLERLHLVPAGAAAAIYPLLQFLAGSADGILMFSAIYRLVPHYGSRPHRVWPGAVFAGICLETLSEVFPLYLHATGDFSTYGLLVGLLLVVLLYFWMIGMITEVGCCLNVELSPPAQPGRSAAV